MRWRRQRPELAPHEREAATREHLRRQDAAVARDERERRRAGMRLIERAVREAGAWFPPSHVGDVVLRSEG